MIFNRNHDQNITSNPSHKLKRSLKYRSKFPERFFIETRTIPERFWKKSGNLKKVLETVFCKKTSFRDKKRDFSVSLVTYGSCNELPGRKSG